MEQLDELLVRASVEHQLALVGVEVDLQYTDVVPTEPGIGEGVLVGLKPITHHVLRVVGERRHAQPNGLGLGNERAAT
jgi:hypothetical protein